ncbi:MFS transporter [Allostreptomyces psammosilenae]|uniref:Putative proline/betaine transporter n=1 Tax=Allostreptomyces psammosilenae TaxID=1892865 RepID=A0A853A699_9ACTN|nr:MFS transporter [Allostreptomyces psammosilenae]NYI06002.1 MHS family alpha-ketoglutarate permease-like MFS transporter [Allostreptomyces psammosilenae]
MATEPGAGPSTGTGTENGKGGRRGGGTAPGAADRPDAGHLPPGASRTRQLLAASVGNATEWFDWYAYSFLAVYFSAQIFPGGVDDPLVPLLSTFAVFAGGFFMRPIGGLLLGSLADRRGRRTALTVTILAMGAGSLLIAVLPTYATAGALAPALLVLARLVQGLSVGGEFAASTTFLVESAGPGRRGLYSSFQYVSTTVGQLLASGTAALLAALLTQEQMETWGWRVVFLLGALLSVTGFWIRRGAAETHHRAAPGSRPGLFEALTRHPRQSLLIVGITLGGTITYYTWTAYLPTYATVNEDIAAGDALTVSTVALAVFALLQPLAGALSDRVGRRPLLIAFAGGSALLTVPLLAALTGSPWSLLLVALAGMTLLSGYTAIAAAVNAEVFPARVRAAGIGFPYSLSVALFGGTAPYVGTWLEREGRPELFAWWVVLLCAVSLLVYLRLPETAHRPLDGQDHGPRDAAAGPADSAGRPA